LGFGAAPRGARHRPGRLASPSRQVKARLSLAAPKNRTTPLQPRRQQTSTQRTPVSRSTLSPQRVTSSDPPGGGPESLPFRPAAVLRGDRTRRAPGSRSP